MMPSEDWAITGNAVSGMCRQESTCVEIGGSLSQWFGTLLPYKSMAKRIVLIRHAETTANEEGRWQGATDTTFSDRGRDQLARLRATTAELAPAIVMSSDLPRAEGSARALGFEPDVDARWREPNVGEWEGLTFAEISERYPGALEALLAGEDVPLGGGERLSSVADRVADGFAELSERLDDGETAVVVSHGLALLTLMAHVVGTRRPAPIQLMTNTGLTTFSVNEHGPQLTTYNDTSHLAAEPPRRPGETHVVLIRHGETPANIEQRWQGHEDWPLTELGHDQARQLAATLPPLAAIYSSPLSRAHDTASAVATAQATGVVVVAELKEIGFGTWENKTRAEIEEEDPGAFEQLRNGVDIVRGRTGETFTAVRERMTRAIDEIVGAHAGETVAIVSHGGASRAYLTGVLGLEFPDRNRLRSLGNTAFGRVVYGTRGPRLAAWNAAPHLVPQGVRHRSMTP